MTTVTDQAGSSNHQPKFGWKVKLNHVFRERRDQYFKPRFKQLLQFLPFSFRYLFFWFKLWRKNKLPFIDGLRPLQVDFHHGVPLGGIGSGSIGRGFHGEFCRYHMIPGIYHHKIVYANQFIVSIRKRGRCVYQQVLSPHYPSRDSFSNLSSWMWSLNGEFAHYCALYPQSWTTYTLPGQNVTLVCRQISPVIPHNYKDSSFPACVFVWTVINNNEEPVDISIAFTFKNGIGCDKEDRRGGCWTEAFSKCEEQVTIKGVSIQQTFKQTMPCSYNIAAIENDSVQVSHCLQFDPLSDGAQLWTNLMKGSLSSQPGKSEITTEGNEIACAISCRSTVACHKTQKMEMSLAWHMPYINFRQNKVRHKRIYTKWFGDDADAGPSICHYALINHPKWQQCIDEWQKPILDNQRLPHWYKSAIFNELYYISDGGSLWLLMPSEDQDQRDCRYEYGRFAYLESHEYRMYNTYDVHFYASFALAMLWPQLQLSLQYDFADTIPRKSQDSLYFLMNGKTSLRKSANTVPHDLGDPEDEPWMNINGYQIHDVSHWKDLNVKFVLQVYRDYVMTKDMQYVTDMWPHVLAVMHKTKAFDKDDDGVIENDGYADQTYDTWIMKGTSAYCGGLWLAALNATIKMAELVKDEEMRVSFSAILEQGLQSFDRKLWNGKYYNFDSSTASHSKSIMADQLCGHWYHKACLHGHYLLPKENVRSALKTIFDFNVMKNGNGTRGAVNGMTPAAKVDIFTLQSEETWTGVTYALAATLIHEGFWDEGMKTAEGMYRTIYEDLGLGFQTPEAIYQKDHYRAPGYMRALAIWAIQWAIEQH